VEDRFEVESAVACVEAMKKSNYTLLDARNLAFATEAAAHFHQLNIAADDACASASQCPPSNDDDYDDADADVHADVHVDDDMMMTV
jgi:hypothetical protein